MLKHASALCGSVLLSAVLAGVVGEAMFPSGPFIGASIWLGCVASIASAILYGLSALGWSDYYRVRKKMAVAAGVIAWRASSTAFVLTTIAVIAFCVAMRQRWIPNW